MKTAVRDRLEAPAAEVPAKERSAAESVDHPAPEIGALIRRYVGEASEGADTEPEAAAEPGPETEPEPDAETDAGAVGIEDVDPELDSEVDTDGRRSVMSEGYGVPGETEEHQAEVVIDGDEVYGVLHSSPKTVAAVFVALTKAGVKPKKFAKQRQRYNHRCKSLRVATDRLRKAQNAARGQPRAHKSHADVRFARSQVNAATHTLLRLCRELHVEFWDKYAGALGPWLMPASILSRQEPFTGTYPLAQYRSGHDATHAIPLVWYKPAEAYPRVRFYDLAAHKWKVVDAFDDFSVTTADGEQHDFGVAAENRPSAFVKAGAYRLRKVAHSGDRGWQQFYNKVLVETGVKVETAPGSNKFEDFAPSKADGDHVRDLGFGGTDTIENYWPLNPDVNRRAFMGYNGFYKLNLLEKSAPTSGYDTGVAMRLGGLIGKYFYIKDFMPATGAGSVPAESGTTDAGHVV